MIKILKLNYECQNCGDLINLERKIIIDEYTSTIKIIKPKRCICGNKKSNPFNLLNITLLDYKPIEEIKKTQRSKLMFVKERLLGLSKINEEVLTEDLKEEVKNYFNEEEFNEVILKLKELGDVFECKKGYIKLINQDNFGKLEK